MSDHSANTITFYVGVALYSWTYLICGIYFVWSVLSSRYRRGEDNEIIVQSFVVDNLSKVFLCVFLMRMLCSPCFTNFSVRIAWFFLRARDWQNDTTFILSRIAFAFYFSTFTLVVFFWAESAHKKYYGTTTTNSLLNFQGKLQFFSTG